MRIIILYLRSAADPKHRLNGNRKHFGHEAGETLSKMTYE